MNNSYIVAEGEGFIDITVGIVAGQLGRETVVTLYTQMVTAQGKHSNWQ